MDTPDTTVIAREDEALPPVAQTVDRETSPDRRAERRGVASC
jgi:hypothetical protein